MTRWTIAARACSHVSARTGDGLDGAAATRSSATRSTRDDWRDAPAITNVRHVALVEQRAAPRSAARGAALPAGATEEFVLADLTRRAARARGDHAARRAPDDAAAAHLSSGSASGNERRADFDVIVIGAGHAGCEAAWAAARLGRARRPLHAVAGHGGAHAVQSGDRRHGEGTSRSRDRRARRPDGPRDRRDGHSVQAAQSQPRTGGLVAARAGGQARATARGCARRLSARAEHRVDLRPGRPRS